MSRFLHNSLRPIFDPLTLLNQSTRTTPNCLTCVHHYITYDTGFPYGCRVMQFKSRRLPMHDVLDASGIECQLFLARVARNNPRR